MLDASKKPTESLLQEAEFQLELAKKLRDSFTVASAADEKKRVCEEIITCINAIQEIIRLFDTSCGNANG